jgi:hypothetical protein
MRPRVTLFVLVALALFASTEEALAWGPATHVGLANEVLRHLSLLPAAVAAVIGRHVFAYLYGNVAADVVFAKRWSQVKQFCHHWSTAFRILEDSVTESDRSFALGYLSHLTADTVAHGKFVPHQVSVCDCTVGFGHLYWELRADAAMDEPMRRLLADVLAADHSDHHAALAPHMGGALLSFDMNRALFERINAVIVHEGFRRTMELWSRSSRWELSRDLLEGYHAESVDRILSVLSQGQRSPVLREDPNGTSALMRLRVDRRDLRRRVRRGLAIEQRLRETSIRLAPCPTELRNTLSSGETAESGKLLTIG